MDLETYDFNSYPVRVALIDGNPWFALADLCRALSLSNPSMVAQRLQPQQLTKLNLGSRRGETLFVSESGMYRTVLRSDSPNAEPFQVWVTEDIIPSIRRTGSYTMAAPAPAPAPALPQTLAEALRFAADLAEERDRAAAELAAVAPKVLAFDNLMDSSGTYSISAAAKLLGTGQQRLFEVLRERGILMDRRRSGNEAHNVPYQVHIDAGRFEVRTSAAPDGVHVSRTTRVTTRGLAWLQALLAPTQPPALPASSGTAHHA